MPKLKNLAVLAAAVEAGRRYAKSNPDKAGRYVDQAAAFVDKQTKGKYSGQIHGAADKVKGATGLPRTPRTQGFEGGAGYGRHGGTPTPSAAATTPVTAAAAKSAPVTKPATTPTRPTPTPSTPASGPSTAAKPATPAAPPPVTTPPVKTPPAGLDPKPAGERFPNSKDV